MREGHVLCRLYMLQKTTHIIMNQRPRKVLALSKTCRIGCTTRVNWPAHLPITVKAIKMWIIQIYPERVLCKQLWDYHQSKVQRMLKKLASNPLVMMIKNLESINPGR